MTKIAKEPTSLETPVGDEEDSNLGDFIKDKGAIVPTVKKPAFREAWKHLTRKDSEFGPEFTTFIVELQA